MSKTSSQFRSWERAFWIIAYASLAGLLICGFAACAEEDPPQTLEQKLQGVWTRQWEHGGAFTTYHFDDGQCLTYAILPAQAVQFYAYAYTTEGDLLRMTDLASTSPFQDIKTAVVSFPTGSTALFVWEDGAEHRLQRM